MALPSSLLECTTFDIPVSCILLWPVLFYASVDPHGKDVPNAKEVQGTATQLLTAELCQKRKPVKKHWAQCDKVGAASWESWTTPPHQLENRVSFEVGGVGGHGCLWCISSVWYIYWS